MALSAQEDTESPSEKARKFPLTAGLPAARYSMAASASRVMFPAGSVPSETPALTAQDWAAAYQGLPPSTLWPFSRASTVQIMARVVAASGEKAAAFGTGHHAAGTDIGHCVIVPGIGRHVTVGVRPAIRDSGGLRLLRHGGEGDLDGHTGNPASRRYRRRRPPQ